MSKEVRVAVGVVLRQSQTTGVTETYVTRRLAHQHQGGKWEFPGGKVEQNESTEQALIRELEEEIGIFVQSSRPLVVISHDYIDKQVILDVHEVLDFSGEPRGLEGQVGQWVTLTDLPTLEFPKANQVIIEKLLNSTT